MRHLNLLFPVTPTYEKAASYTSQGIIFIENYQSGKHNFKAVSVGTLASHVMLSAAVRMAPSMPVVQ